MAQQAQKMLYLVRHAKSSWEDSNLNDHDRPLNKRGRRDVLGAATRLRAYGLLPNCILTSSALRARSTAVAIANKIDLIDHQLVIVPELYEASAQQLVEIIRRTDQEIESLMLVSHNPAITDLVNGLSGGHYENIPTCGVFGMQLNQPDWQGLQIAMATIIYEDYPKKHRG